MKALIIYPVIEDDRAGRAPLAFRAANMVTSYLAALFPDGVEVEVIDEYVEPMRYDIDADLVAISVLTPTAYYSYGIADRLRRQGHTVIAGGIHPSVFPEEAIQHFDAVVIGEGEETIPELVRDFQAGRLRKFYRAPGPANLENLPTPRWDLLKGRRYIIPRSVFATRGCPYRCSFCSIHLAQGRGFRKRPLRKVVEEIERIDTRRFLFWDDNLTADQRYAHDLFDAIAPLGKTWTSQTDFNVTQDETLLKTAKKSGCVGFFIGIESISEASLQGVRKFVNVVKKYREGIQRLHDNGLSLGAGMMVGFDSDGRDIFQQTLEFAHVVHMDAAYFKIVTPYPGTEAFAELERQGRILTRDWSRYQSHKHVVYRPALMEPEELKAGFHWMTREFYSVHSMARRLWGAHAGTGILGSLPVNIGHWLFYYFLDRHKGYNPAGGDLHEDRAGATA
ncbi:MAG: radical SAM protein [Hyphomicrobiaceae bacterium]|nr:MAG: radical SAM protein [Hyphomicrobiaceae bacterium]